MGAYSPTPIVTPALESEIMQQVIGPVVQALAKQGTPYTACCTPVSWCTTAPEVLEFTSASATPSGGSPLTTPFRLLDLLARTCEGGSPQTLEWDPRAAVCIVLAAEGYPVPSSAAGRSTGSSASRVGQRHGLHAGTRIDDGRLVTDGGRVLGVTALGDTIDAAVTEAYAAVDQIRWPGCIPARHRPSRAGGGAKGRQHGGA